MRPATAVAALVAVVGALLLLGQFATPLCRNYAGTARDSGYPCHVDRSSGATDYVLSRETTISVPWAIPVSAVLVVGGLGSVLLTRRR